MMAAGTVTTRSAPIHASASAARVAVGPPRQRARSASTTTVIGLTFAKAWSHPGMVATGHSQGEGGKCRNWSRVEPKAHGKANHDHQPDHENVAHRVGSDSPRKDCRIGERQGTEPVDDAAGEILSDGDSRLGGTKADSQYEDARKQKIDVGRNTRRMDCPSEDVSG